MSELEAVQKMKDGMLVKAMQKPAVQKSIEIGKEVALEVGMELLDEATGGVASLAFGVAGSRRGRKTGGSASGSGTGRSEPQATQKDRSPDKDQANEQKLRKVANGDLDYSGEVRKKGIQIRSREEEMVKIRRNHLVSLQKVRGREILLMHTVVITNVSNKEQMITIIKLGNGHLLRRHLHPMDLTGQTEKQKKQQIY
ncbi:hypothetical protein QJ48_17360 [Paenibacillus sp. A3]|uniref:hypothetical protein n=1 Tax=Paenibacillus sp. A3 TaxID=1337054 RepID=UPI0006D5751D|nr:hypothetical protein [Paenibacillus sp. A3]KPV58250.1 hypothetical protein QJ48_17360 [Paenibacillus sp. A3]